MNKNIWIINQYAGSVFHGKEYRTPSIARELQKQGYNVTIIAASHSHHFKTAPEISCNYTLKDIEGVKYLWIKTGKYIESKSYKRLLSMFSFMLKCFFIPIEKLNKPDYIIVSSPSPLPILNGIYFKKRFKAKLIFEVRDLWPLSVIELGNISSKNLFICFLAYIEKIAYTKSDLVISLLANAKEYMLSRGLKAEKFLFIPNGIDLKLLNNRQNVSNEILKHFTSSTFIIGYAGALGIANNLYAFIDAAELLKENKKIKFFLLGSGSEDNKLREYAKKKKLDNVIFLGSVAREEVHNTLEYFDICYLGLQKSELFQYGVSPTKLYDYMAVSKPILYAIDSGNHPVLDANCGIEVSSGNANDIATAVQQLYRMDIDERLQLGKNGYEVLMNYYTFDKLTKKIIESLEAL